MRKMIAGMLVLFLFFSMPFTVKGSSSLSTEQKYEVLKQKNIFSGFSDGSSRLYESMSREQLAAVLFRLLELPTPSNSSTFDDVLRTRWSYHEIEAVSRAGLMLGLSKRKFAPQMNVTVEQMAAIFVRSYGISAGGNTPVTGKVSKWARGAVSMALDRHLIPQLSDNTVDATRGLLVEAAYSVYEDTHIEPLRIRSVEPLSNQSVRVHLLQWTNTADKSRFVLKDAYGNFRSIHQATISQDGMSVVLWTDRLSGGTVHTLSVDGIAWSYVSFSEDTTKPQIVSQPVRLPNKAYEITFSEPVEQSSATNSNNYSINNGLKIRTLQLSSDARKVTFTTWDQSNGRSYQLTVRNVKDLAGNVMDTRNDLYFVGNNDDSKPKVTEVRIDPDTALVSVKFSEKIDPQQAVQTHRYSIDKGLGVVQATLIGDGQTVILKTTQQQDGNFYSLTVSGIADIAGNVMDSSSGWKFGAVSNPLVPVKLSEIKAINQNTLEVTFDRAITSSDASHLKVIVWEDNGSKVSMENWSAFVQWKPGSDRAVTVQFRTKSSNPNLFVTGHWYGASISGVLGLVTINDADYKEFGGTVTENRIPYVTQAIVLDSKRVKVIFSEPVKGVNETAFRIREKDGDKVVKIVDDELNDTSKIVTEVVLKLDNEIEYNKNYEMSFESNIIFDAAGWNGLKISDGSTPYILSFKRN